METPNEHIAQVFDRLASVCVREALAASAQSALRFKAKQFERVAATTGRWQPRAIDQLAKLDADLASGAAPGSSRATS